KAALILAVCFPAEPLHEQRRATGRALQPPGEMAGNKFCSADNRRQIALSWRCIPGYSIVGSSTIADYADAISPSCAGWCRARSPARFVVHTPYLNPKGGRL